MSKTSNEQNDGQQADSPAARLLAALDLMDFAINLMRQNLRRRNPSASEQTIDAELQAWLEK